MGTITLKIADEIEKKLRMKAGERGLARGNLSKSVEEAIELWLHSGTAPDPENIEFRAIKDGLTVAEAATLTELGEHLKKKGLDPRSVIIQSSRPPEPLMKLGLRTKNFHPGT